MKSFSVNKYNKYSEFHKEDLSPHQPMELVYV